MTEKRYHVRAGYYYEYTGICKSKEENLTTNEVCDLLNEQEKRINNLKETIIKITLSYHQKHDNTIVDLVDEVYEEDIGDLFIEWNHGDVK